MPARRHSADPSQISRRPAPAYAARMTEPSRLHNKRPPHVVHILTRWMLAGSEENTLGTCIGQIDAGYRVTIVYGKESDPRMLSRVDPRIQLIQESSMVHPIKPLQDLRALFSLAGLLKRIDADVVHTHQSKAGVLGRVAARMARVRWIIHGVHIVPFQNVSGAAGTFYVLLERALASMTDSFIHVSAGVRSAYLNAGIGTHKPHEVVYSGMDLAKFKHPALPDDWRALLGLSEGQPKPPVVVMLAALEPRKRHLELIEAFPGLARRVPGVRLLMAGGGEASYRPIVDKAIEESAHREHIRFVGHRPDPEAIIGLADVCILCSLREGLPRVVVQYITAGKPAVVTDLEGLDEIVHHESNGLIVAPEPLSHLMDAVAELLTQPERLMRMSQGAQATLTEQWTVEAMRASSNRIYAALMNQAERPLT